MRRMRIIVFSVLNLTCQQIKEFVDGHNHRRLSIARGIIENQPAGNNLKQMVSLFFKFTMG